TALSIDSRGFKASKRQWPPSFLAQKQSCPPATSPTMTLPSRETDVADPTRSGTIRSGTGLELRQMTGRRSAPTLWAYPTAKEPSPDIFEVREKSGRALPL